MPTGVNSQLQSTNREQGISPRNPYTALVLSICPGLGQQYAGHLVRGILAYALLVIASWLAAVLFLFIDGLFSLILLAVPFVGVALIGLDAYRCAAKQPKGYKRQWFNQAWIYALVFASLLVTINPLMDFLVGSNIVRAYFVTTEGMAPKVLKYDLLVIDKLSSPNKGDIVLVDYRTENRLRQLSDVVSDQLIRRIIAVPGDTVEIRGRQVFVNDEPLDEPYATFGQGSSHDLFDENYRLEPKKVPTDSFFVLADARNFGLDSRILGFIHKDEVEGIATKIFWSWNLDAGSFKWERTASGLDRN